MKLYKEETTLSVLRKGLKRKSFFCRPPQKKIGVESPTAAAADTPKLFLLHKYYPNSLRQASMPPTKLYKFSNRNFCSKR